MKQLAHEAAGKDDDSGEEIAGLAASLRLEQIAPAEEVRERLTQEAIAPALGVVFTRQATERLPVPVVLPPVSRPRVPRTITGAELV